MGLFAKVLSLSYDSAAATKTTALKSYYRSVRLIRDADTINPGEDSKYTNVLLCGNCIDKETRNLYVFYIDTFYGAAWIIEINLDSRIQTVVYYDKYNAIGFDPQYKIYNAKVVYGRLVWTDGLNPVYQMDIKRAKKSFAYKIGYGQYPETVEWNESDVYAIDQIVSNGNKFYKNLSYNNVGIEPRLGDSTAWEELCLIEDAYYSQKIENFYFEAMPPKHPPVVTYETDNDRKINNLRRTLFQVAYRYVYIDWRKSTFSPASIVPIPQAEEEVATGLANEQISLNNKLKITVNFGGEEVRAVEIIGRSSDDPTKWYLLESINKFEEEEKGGEVSVFAYAPRMDLTITVEQPIVTSKNYAVVGLPPELILSVKDTSIWMTYVSASVNDMEWDSDEFGLALQIPTIISMGDASQVFLTSKPSWITVIENDGGEEITVGGLPITNGMIISLYPNVENLGPQKLESVVFTDDTVFANSCNILVTHKSPTSIPTVGVYVHPEDGSGLVISGESGTATNGSAWISVTFTPEQAAYGPLVGFSLNYSILKNSVAVGSGTILVTNYQSATRTLTMSSVALPAQGIQVLLWEGSLLP